MNSPIDNIASRRSLFALATRGGALAAVALLLAALANGCDGGNEGERCNPLLSHDQCGGGLSCQQPATCAESYCCPANASSSTNPFCNGSACPASDAGGDAAKPLPDASDAPSDGPDE